MNRNIGPIDGPIRTAIGLAVLGLTVVGPRTLWGLPGLVPLLKAPVGWCPPSSAFGISTCKSSVKA